MQFLLPALRRNSKAELKRFVDSRPTLTAGRWRIRVCEDAPAEYLCDFAVYGVEGVRGSCDLQPSQREVPGVRSRAWLGAGGPAASSFLRSQIAVRSDSTATVDQWISSRVLTRISGGGT